VGALLLIRGFQQRDAIQGAAPSIEAPLVTGGTGSLARLRGRPVAIHFWASWCGVCRAMKGNVVRLAEEHPDQVITVAVGSGDGDAIRAYLREQGLLDPSGQAAFPVVADPRGRLARAYGVQAYPTTFFLDPEGNVRTVEVGYTSSVGLSARLLWAGL